MKVNTVNIIEIYAIKIIYMYSKSRFVSSSAINCFINFFLLNDKSYYHINNCNEGSAGMFREEIYKRFFKPFFFLSHGMIISFIIIFSKENSNYKFNRFLIFLSGIITIIISKGINLHLIFSFYSP